MIFICEHCGNRIKYNIEKQLMRCESCGRLAETPETRESEIRFDQYHCADCGAVLAVNEDEMTSDCPYCGAQSLLFDDKAYGFAPKYIIPFGVTRNGAANIARREFKRYLFTPGKIRNFDEANLKPIYVPFQLHKLYIHSSQSIQGIGFNWFKGKFGKFVHSRAIGVTYENVEVDVSKNLPDCLSIQLSPWNWKKMKKFHPMYISGLYCGVDDVGEQDALAIATERAKGFIDRKIMESCKETYKNRNAGVKNYKCSMLSQELVLFPVWFFSSEYKGKKYVAIINGESGKIVSAVPIFKGYMALSAVISGIICYFPMNLILSFLQKQWLLGMSQAMLFFVAMVVVILSFVASGYRKYVKYKNHLNAAWSSSIVKMAESEE